MSCDPYAGVQKQLHIWNHRPIFAYSLDNFCGLPVKNKVVYCLLFRPLMLKGKRAKIFVLLVQVKHNLEQEVENMEDEIVRLKAQLEGNSDLEEAKMSDKENIAGDSSWHGRTMTPISVASRTVNCDVSAVDRDVTSDMATAAETEDWPELSANTVKICESMMLQHDTTVRQCLHEYASVVGSDCGLVSAESKTEKTSADLSTAKDLLQEVTSLVKDHGCSTSAVSLSDVSGLLMSKSRIQLGDAGDLVEESVSAVPDSLERTPSACNVEDDADGYLSCEDMVIPDSEDDLYSSPENANIDAAASDRDDSKHVNMSVKVSSGDIHRHFEKVGGSTQLVNMSDAHVTQHDIVNSSAGPVSKEECESREECRREESIRKNESNNTASPRNDTSLSDDTMKQVFNMVVDVDVHNVAEESHLSATDQPVDAAASMHQQPRTATSAVYQQQLPKRPHWTFVVSGISQAEVMVLIILLL